MNARTTYSDLTAGASDHLHRALVLVQAGVPSAQLTGITVMQADLAAALAHLGEVLIGPIVATRRAGGSEESAASSPRRRVDPDRRVIRQLRAASRVRDWTDETPREEPVAAELRRAARLVRTAADLWATHRTPGGALRSLESSRIRHPATLGAACRQWRELTSLAGAIVAEVLVESEQVLGPVHPASTSGIELLPGLRRVPRPAVASAAPAPQVDLTVARPSPRRSGAGADPLVLIHELVDRVREAVWVLSESGTAPAPVLANTAAIGMMLHRAASDAQRRAARDSAADAATERLVAAATEKDRQGLWARVAQQVASIRTPHPSLTVLQIERLDLARLIAKAQSSSGGDRRDDTADALSRAATAFDEVADFHRRALSQAHERAEIYLAGHALTYDLLARRADLLEAKLHDRAVPAPTVIVRRLDDAYRAIVGEPSLDAVPSSSRPAA